MDFRNKHLLGLYITVIYFVGPACAACKKIEDEQIYTTKAQLSPVKTPNTELKPSIKKISDTFVSIPTTICRSQIRDYNIIVNKSVKGIYTPLKLPGRNN